MMMVRNMKIIWTVQPDMPYNLISVSHTVIDAHNKLSLVFFFFFFNFDITKLAKKKKSVYLLGSVLV